MKGIPDPPPITPEVQAHLVAEARQWVAEAVRRAAAIETFTAEDLATPVR